MAEDTIKREDYAPITQELRGRLKVAALGLSKPMVDGLLAECDNIDAIHRSLELENERLRDASKRGDGWPLDADRVPIRAGEELFWKEDGTSAGRVTAIGVGERAGWVWLLHDGSNVSIGRQANKLCHTKFDTWESILADALGCEPHEVAEDDDLMALVGRCKALAGEDE